MPRPGSIGPRQQAKLDAKLAAMKPAVLKGTKPQKSKMAPFSARKKDETGTKGSLPGGQINAKQFQSTGAKSLPSKGGKALGGTVPTRKQIDQAPMQKKRLVPGSDISAKNPKTGNTRMKGTIAQSGPQYGGGGRNTQ